MDNISHDAIWMYRVILLTYIDVAVEIWSSARGHCFAWVILCSYLSKRLHATHFTREVPCRLQLVMLLRSAPPLVLVSAIGTAHAREFGVTRSYQRTHTASRSQRDQPPSQPPK